MTKNTYFKDLLIYLIPLALGVGLISLTRSYIETAFPYNLMIPKSIYLVLIGMSYYLLVKKQKYTLVNSLLATSMLIASIWMMYGAQTTLGGMEGDNYFSTSMIATFMKVSHSEDFTFSNLSSFYPYYFHYFIAKLGHFFDLTPQKTLKYGTFLVIYISPILIYFFWRKIYSNEKSLLITFATLFVLGIEMYFRKPYEAISLILIVPWWIYYFSISEKNYQNAIIGGVIGGLLFGIYYYWFFPIILASIVFLFLDYKETKEKKVYVYYIILSISLLLIASPYLLPYIFDLLNSGSEPYQNRWFMPDHLDFPLQQIVTLKDVFFLIGLLYLIISRNKVVEKHLLILLFTSYIWIFLGHLAIINDTPLLHTKISIFIKLLLSIGFVLFLHKIFIHYKQDRSTKSIGSFILLIFAIGPFFFSLSSQYNSKVLLDAKNFRVPSISQDANLMKMLTGKTILASTPIIWKLNPYAYLHFFTDYVSYYSHPSSLIFQRLVFLNLLSKSKNKYFIQWSLQNNKFSKIEYVWLGKDGVFYITHDNFPHQPCCVKFEIKFQKNFFDSLQKVKGYENLYKVPKNTKKPEYDILNKIEKAIYDLFIIKKKISKTYISEYLERNKIYINKGLE